MDKSLKNKAIDFKGKKYVLISDRVNFFTDTFPQGCIKTDILSKTEDDRVIVKATVIPDISTPDKFFNGMSQAKWSDLTSFVNKMSALENAETSAVGRALAFMGIGVIDSIASIDEINKASYNTSVAPQNAPKTALTSTDDQVCPLHNITVPKRISKSTNKPYWLCNGDKEKVHFLDDPNKISNDEPDF